MATRFGQMSCAGFVLIAAQVVFAESVSEADLVAYADEVMSEYVARGGAAAVMVVRNGTVLLRAGYGRADREKDLPVRADTVFSLGSVTKQFTGAAIARLESESKLAANDTLTEFFDNVPEDKSAITIRQLLAHSSGFVDSIGPDEEPIAREPYLAQAFASKLQFEPGTRYAYSNTGYSILAAIIENVTGESYERYLSKTFFVPLGMNDTGYVLPQWDADRVAVGYKSRRRWGTVPEHAFGPDGPGWHLMGNGGVHSTLDDMYRWHRALLDGSAVPQPFADKLFDKIISEGGETYYGYGWSLEEWADGSLIATHNGSNGIFFASLFRRIDEDSFVMVFTSQLYRYDESFARRLAEMAFLGRKP